MIDETASCTVEHCTNPITYVSTLGVCDGKYYCEQHTPYYCQYCHRNKSYVDTYNFYAYNGDLKPASHIHPYNKYIESGGYDVRCICLHCIDTDKGGYIEYCNMCGHYYSYHYADEDTDRYHGCVDIKDPDC